MAERAARAVPTCRAAMSGTGLTGSRTRARLSLNVYSTVSVLMMVQHEPSFSSSRLASFGHGDACRECHSSKLGTGHAGERDWGALGPAGDSFTHWEEIPIQDLSDNDPTKALPPFWP